MSIKLNDSIRVKGPKPVEDKNLNNGVPYTSITQAKSLIAKVDRYPSLSVIVGVNGINQEWWWKDGIEDTDLIIKTVEIPEVNLSTVANRDASNITDPADVQAWKALIGLNAYLDAYLPKNNGLATSLRISDRIAGEDGTGSLSLNYNTSYIDSYDPGQAYAGVFASTQPTKYYIDLVLGFSGSVDMVKLSRGLLTTQLYIDGDNGHIVYQDIGGLRAAKDYSTTNPTNKLYYAQRKYVDDAIAAAGGGGTTSQAWADITGKPSTFVPSAHSHPISDVTNLQSTLDGKAASSHTHTTAQVTGLDTALAGKAASSHTHLWAHITDKPSTFAPSAHTHTIANVTNLQTTLDGKASTTHTHLWVDITNKPTTISGYGITDTYTKTESDNKYQLKLVSGTDVKTINGASILGSGDIVVSGGGGTTDLSAYQTTAQADAKYQLQGTYLTSVTWSQVGAKPTTIAGYGITDVYTKTESNTKNDAQDAAIAAGAMDKSGLVNKMLSYWDATAGKLVSSGVEWLKSGFLKVISIVLTPNAGTALPNELGTDGTFLWFGVAKRKLRFGDIGAVFNYTPTGDFTLSSVKTAMETAGYIFNDTVVHITLGANNFVCTIDNGAANIGKDIYLRRTGAGSISFVSSRTLTASDTITIMSGNEAAYARVFFGTSSDLLFIANP